ncbi:CFEM domain-containing protein [Mycena indigotica]|uniref:CFEM domain-containing protein n=1 Tax=Mycena indigotica TaxID=2126181 RepID=A0A8H6W3J5_9AGAR|nr:CFEM domain-containing protein [Mycena indigotica]KAF7303662.1 CFEM domain-containing protein [Mycena indigotica]
MRLFLSFLALATLANAANVQRQLPGFPSCATNCLNNPTTLGGCSIADEKCLCQSVPYLQSTLACINAACPSPEDQQKSIVGAENLCSNFGVTITSQSAAIFGGLSTVANSPSGVSGGSSGPSSPAPSPPAPSKGSATNLKVGGLTYLPAIVVPAFAVFL